MAKPPSIPEELLKEGVSSQYIYCGLSMQPTFKSGQLLYVRPDLRDIAVGDVIVFKDRTKQTYVVHRVIKVTHNNYYTRGDNNHFDDLDPVHPKDVLGVVRWTNQDGVISPVQGGKRGLRILNKQKNRNQISAMVKRLFYPIYQVIKKSRVIPKLWHPEIKNIYLNTGDGVVVKYVYNNRTIAEWNPALCRFTYRHPFDLIIKPPENSK